MKDSRATNAQNDEQTAPTGLQLVRVAGTTYGFGSLPSDVGEPTRAMLVAKRENILCKARKVHGGRAPCYSSERVSLATCKSEAAAGSVIEVDGRRAEVWAPGPASRSVWALLDDGKVVLAERSKYHTGGWHTHTVAAPDQRQSVVLGLIERETKYSRQAWRYDISNPLVSPAVRHSIAVQLAWWAWQQLYPTQQPSFEALVATPNRDTECQSQRHLAHAV